MRDWSAALPAGLGEPRHDEAVVLPHQLLLGVEPGVLAPRPLQVPTLPEAFVLDPPLQGSERRRALEAALPEVDVRGADGLRGAHQRDDPDLGLGHLARGHRDLDGRAPFRVRVRLRERASGVEEEDDDENDEGGLVHGGSLQLG